MGKLNVGPLPEKSVIYPSTRDNADNPLFMRINQKEQIYFWCKITYIR